MDTGNNIYRKISVTLTEGRDWIDLSSSGLSELPIELLKLKYLKRLNISSNPLQELPGWLFDLSNLEVLDIRNIQLVNIPNEITKLHKLTNLIVSSNSITVIPDFIKNLENLKLLFATNNKISVIPSWVVSINNINFINNPIVDPPLEIFNRGTYAIKNYFEEKEKGKQKIYEAKLLIVGEGGAGKTSLMKKLLDSSYELNSDEFSTKGIEIVPYYFNTAENINFRVNIWDFGGQEIYHATHQFFLTKRSLYILLADNRAEDTDFNYWLQTVELLSDYSPVLLYQNEKQNRRRDINLSAIRERFVNVLKLFSFNLSNNYFELERLRREVEYQIQQLPHIGNELPISWVKIRNRLEEIAVESPFIEDTKYYSICNELGGFDIEQSLLLSEYYHDLGTFLHFKENPVLKRWIILKPEWGTDAVYKILDNQTVINKNGYFNKHDLSIIWNEDCYKRMHDELLSLMMKFELCYKLENADEFIAPQLLSRDKPVYSWIQNKNSIIVYDYDFLPKGIITRFIVRMHYYIDDQSLVWREGVVLKREDSIAEIIQTYGRREIFIKVRGESRKDFLAIIIDQLDRINSDYKRIRVKKMIPCNCFKCSTEAHKHLYDYNLLKKYISHQIKSVRCEESMTEVEITKLIFDALGNPNQKGAKYNVYISHSQSDIDDKILIKFKKNLKLILSAENLVSWDKGMIKLGDNIKTEKSEKISNAEIIIALISVDYINDDDCYIWEYSKALELQEINDILLIPVIIRPMDYENCPFGKIRPLVQQDESDSSFVKIVTEIRRIIQQHKNEKNERRQYDSLALINKDDEAP